MVVLRLVVHQGLAEEEVVRRLDIEQEDMVAEGAGRVDQEAAADIQPSERQPFCLQADNRSRPSISIALGWYNSEAAGL